MIKLPAFFFGLLGFYLLYKVDKDYDKLQLRFLISLACLIYGLKILNYGTTHMVEFNFQ